MYPLSLSLTILYIIHNNERFSMDFRLRIFALAWKEAYESTREYEIVYSFDPDERFVPPSERSRHAAGVIDDDWKKVRNRDDFGSIKYRLVDEALQLDEDEPFEPHSFFSDVLARMETSSSEDLKELAARVREYIVSYERDRVEEYVREGWDRRIPDWRP